jgi:hypothetical protein
MSQEHPTDPMLRILARLPGASPSAASTERIRGRCHAVLQHQHQRALRQQRVARVARSLEAAVLGGLFMYLAEIVAEALRLSRIS